MKLGLIGAMEVEIELFRDGMQDVQQHERAGIRFWTGTFLGCDTVLCQSGVGKVNAAVCTQILIDQFGVDEVIFTGVAGALDPTLNVGDIVVSVDCLQHDVDATVFGYQPGQVPRMPAAFPADQQLVAKAIQASEQVTECQTIKGRVLSGDQFIAHRETVHKLHEVFQGTCVEMEGAAVAQVCFMNQTPFVIIRSMSDKADGSAEVSYQEFKFIAAKRCHAIVSRMMSHQ